MIEYVHLAKKISDAIFEAVESGYYHERTDFMNPNFMEIREWVPTSMTKTAK